MPTRLADRLATRRHPDEPSCSTMMVPRPAATPASRTAFISGRSPIETSFARKAWWVGPPAVYGSVDQMSKWTRAEHVAWACRPADRQSSERMNASGATAVEIPNGASPPATTRFPVRLCTLVANAFTIIRYQPAAPGLYCRFGTLFGSFQASQ